MARAVPLEIGVHLVRLARDAVQFAVKTVRLARLGRKHQRGIGFVTVDVERALHRNAGAVVEREILRRRLVELVNLGKTDVGTAIGEDVAVREYTRIDFAFLGIVFPRPVKIAARSQQQPNH